MDHGTDFDIANTHYRQDVETLKKRAGERKARKRLEAAAPDLLDACKELVRFCESKERLSQDDVCPTKAYELSKAAIKQCRG